MIDTDKILEETSAAIHEGRFAQAERALRSSLQASMEEDEADALLQQLMHLHSHAQNRDVDKAQMYMDMREARQPLAHIALSQAYFQQHIKSDLQMAGHWAEKAIERAYVEGDWPTLYSASALNGLLAKNFHEQASVIRALDVMDSLIGKDESTCYGDAVLLLEAVVLDGPEISSRAKRLARRIAPFIDNEEFRTRANVLGDRAGGPHLA